MENYQYPLDLNWSTEEMILVVNFWADLEKVYEQGMDRCLLYTSPSPRDI